MNNLGSCISTVIGQYFILRGSVQYVCFLNKDKEEKKEKEKKQK